MLLGWSYYIRISIRISISSGISIKKFNGTHVPGGQLDEPPERARASLSFNILARNTHRITITISIIVISPRHIHPIAQYMN